MQLQDYIAPPPLGIATAAVPTQQLREHGLLSFLPGPGVPNIISSPTLALCQRGKLTAARKDSSVSSM